MSTVETSAPVLGEARVVETAHDLPPPQFESGGEEHAAIPVPGLISLPPRDDPPVAPPAPPSAGPLGASSGPPPAGGPSGRGGSGPSGSGSGAIGAAALGISPLRRSLDPLLGPTFTRSATAWRPVAWPLHRGRPAAPALRPPARPGASSISRYLRRSTGPDDLKTGPDEAPAGSPPDALRRGDPIAPRDLAAMREDVTTIVGYLQQQILPESDERAILRIIRGWADRDDTPGEGSRYLDAFLLQLKTRAYSRRTARSGWVEQHALAYDDLWHELEDDRLEEFKSLLARSQHQRTDGPLQEQAESIYSFIGKREAVGLWGMLKGMGTTIIGGTVDTAIWLAWKQTGQPLGRVLDQLGIKVEALEKAPQITPFLEKNFDETAKILGQTLSVDIHEQVDLGFATVGTYELGTAGGKVVGGLTMAGAGNAESVGTTVATGMKVVGAVGAAQSADGLIDTVAKLRTGDPKTGAAPLSWSEIASRADLWAQLAGVIGGATGAADVKNLAVKFGIPALQTGLLVTAFTQVDDDPRYSTPDQRSAQKVELFTQIVVQGATLVDGVNTERKDRKVAAAKAEAAKADAAKADAAKADAAKADAAKADAARVEAAKVGPTDPAVGLDSAPAAGPADPTAGPADPTAGAADAAAPGTPELGGRTPGESAGEPASTPAGRATEELFGQVTGDIGDQLEPTGLGPTPEGRDAFGPTDVQMGAESEPAGIGPAPDGRDAFGPPNSILGGEAPRLKPGEPFDSSKRRPDLRGFRSVAPAEIDRHNGLRTKPNAGVSVFPELVPDRVGPVGPGEPYEQGHQFERNMRNDYGAEGLRETHQAGDKTRIGDVGAYEVKYKTKLSSDDLDQIWRDLQNESRGHDQLIIMRSLDDATARTLAKMVAVYESLTGIKAHIAVRETEPGSRAPAKRP